MLVGGLLYEGVFTMLCWTYRNSLVSAVTFSGPFPTAVSWLLFGIWLCPAFFVVIYIVFFHDIVAPKENLKQFDLLVKRVRGETKVGNGT